MSEVVLTIVSQPESSRRAVRGGSRRWPIIKHFLADITDQKSTVTITMMSIMEQVSIKAAPRESVIELGQQLDQKMIEVELRIES